MDIKQALELVVLGTNLSAAEMRDVMRQIMTGNATDAQIGAFLVALRMKGESIDEIADAGHQLTHDFNGASNLINTLTLHTQGN